MARVTVEDCIRRGYSRFSLVHVVTQRVRQLRGGSQPAIIAPKNEDVVIALREIAAGKISLEEEESEDKEYEDQEEK
jgi:DNA-directed RNA polymerase subunit omega